MKSFAGCSCIEMVHAFLKPCTRESMESILDPDVFAALSRHLKTVIEKGESNKDLVFFLELGCYIWNGGHNDPSNLDVALQLLSSRDVLCFNSNCDYFSRQCDFRSYISRDPPIVETNTAHGAVPHPSFATLIDKQHVVTLLNHRLGSNERGDDSTDEISIILVKSNTQQRSGHDVPMFPMPKTQTLPTSESLSFFPSLFGFSDSCREPSGRLQRSYHEFMPLRNNPSQDS